MSRSTGRRHETSSESTGCAGSLPVDGGATLATVRARLHTATPSLLPGAVRGRGAKEKLLEAMEPAMGGERNLFLPPNWQLGRTTLLSDAPFSVNVVTFQPRLLTALSHPLDLA